MSGPTWEWIAPSGETIAASLDAVQGLESIYVGKRLVSRAHIGKKPEGHAIADKPGGEDYRRAAPSLVVIYDPVRGAFDLRANGQLVPPAARPPSLAPARLGAPVILAPAPMPSSGRGWIAALAVGVFVIVACIGVIVKRRSAEPPAGELLSDNGLARIHYPAGWEPMKPKVPRAPAPGALPGPSSSGYIAVHHFVRDEGIYVLSERGGTWNSFGRDPWVISNALHKRFAQSIQANLFKENATITENERIELPCLGQSGAVVKSTFRSAGETGTFWTCTFIREGDAFMVGYVVNSNVAADEAGVLAILEKTELLGR